MILFSSRRACTLSPIWFLKHIRDDKHLLFRGPLFAPDNVNEWYYDVLNEAKCCLFICPVVGTMPHIKATGERESGMTPFSLPCVNDLEG